MLKINVSILCLLAFFNQALKAHVIVQGHRGCRGLLPENTLPAFKAALEGGADVLEMDLAVSKEGELVISHDPFINPVICRYKDGSPLERQLLIHDLTLAEIKSFDCGSLKHPNFEQQRPVPYTEIPTLEEVFELVRTSTNPRALSIGFNIETKIFTKNPEYTVGPDEFVTLIMKAFKMSGFMERITLQSFDFRILTKAKAVDPLIKTVALVDDPSINMPLLGKQLDVFAVSPDFKLLSEELVVMLHEAGLEVIPWTINTIEDWQRAINMGVDAIITDYPQALRNYLSLSHQ